MQQKSVAYPRMAMSIPTIFVIFLFTSLVYEKFYKIAALEFTSSLSLVVDYADNNQIGSVAISILAATAGVRLLLPSLPRAMPLRALTVVGASMPAAALADRFGIQAAMVALGLLGTLCGMAFCAVFLSTPSASPTMGEAAR